MPCTRNQHLEIIPQWELLQVNSNSFKPYIQCACTGTSLSAPLTKYVSLIYCFYGTILDSYQENFVLLWAVSCRCVWQSGSSSCVIINNWAYCIIQQAKRVKPHNTLKMGMTLTCPVYIQNYCIITWVSLVIGDGCKAKHVAHR